MEKGILSFKKTLIFSTICLLIFSSFSFAQQSEHFRTFKYENVQLRDALNYLINEYNTPLVFQDKDVDSIKVSANCKSCKIDVALNLILKNTPLKWKKVEHQYIIFHPQTLKIKKQTTADISGCVVDSIKNEALPFANILLKDSNKGTISNLEGQFALLNVSARLCTVQVKYIGYSPNEVQANASDSTDYLTIKMRQEAIKTKGVTITGDRIPVIKIFDNPGQARFYPHDINFIPSANRSDIMQSLQALPSVSFFSNELDGLYVRGGTPDQNLVLFDGIPIYHTEHLMGFMSAFNSYAIDEVKLHKGIFSAKYGDRLSSVIELQGKSADTTKFKAGFHANFFSAQGFVQVPFSEKLQGYFTYRKSYFNKNLHKLQFAPNYDKFSYYSILNYISSTSERSWFSNSDLDFYDVTGNLLFKPTTRDKWIFSLYSGKDEAVAKKTFSPTNKINKNKLIKNSGFSVKWSRLWSERIKSNFIVAYSKYSNEYSVSYRYFEGIIGSSNSFNDIADYNYRLSCEMNFHPFLNISYGIDFTKKTIENNSYYANASTNMNSYINTAWTQSFYLQDDITLFYKTKLILGIRGSAYTLKKPDSLSFYKSIDKKYFDPLISFEHYLTGQLKFNAAWRYSHQYVHRFLGKNLYESSGVIWTLPDAKMQPASAKHLSLGFVYNSAFTLLELSVYQKNYNNLVYFSPDNSLNKGTYLYNYFETGTGKSLGLEILVQKKLGFLQGWISYHLGKTEYHFDTVNNGITFLADFDRRHEVKSVIYFPLGTWKCSMAGFYASGKPYTPVENLHSLNLINDEKKWFIHFGPKNSKRLPDYKRLDVSLSKPFKNKFSVSGEIGFSILNLFGINNYARRTYSLVESDNIYNSERYMLGFTPMLFIDLKFK